MTSSPAGTSPCRPVITTCCPTGASTSCGRPGSASCCAGRTRRGGRSTCRRASRWRACASGPARRAACSVSPPASSSTAGCRSPICSAGVTARLLGARLDEAADDAGRTGCVRGSRASRRVAADADPTIEMARVLAADPGTSVDALADAGRAVGAPAAPALRPGRRVRAGVPRPGRPAAALRQGRGARARRSGSPSSLRRPGTPTSRTWPRTPGRSPTARRGS